MKILLLLIGLACAQGTPTSPGASSVPPLPPVVDVTLKNGMRFLILERHVSPTVAFHTAYQVGAVYDVPGKTGLAHLFEHMIFKGTKTINTKDYKSEAKAMDRVEQVGKELILEQAKRQPDPERVKKLREELEAAQKDADQYIVPDEYERLYTQQGGTHFNAFTAEDETAYIVSLPSNKVDLWMTVEADRFRNPVLREFYRERNVVMEERRMNYESAPEGAMWSAFLASAFVAHPYHNEGIGWMSDIAHISRTDTEEFFKKYYGPNNAVVSIVGDVDAKKIIEQARAKFEDIPTRPVPPDLLSVEPEQKGERRTTVRFEAQPRLLIGWKKKDYHDKDQAAIEMIDGILSMGRTSRFYKNLVEGKKLAASIETSTDEPGRKFPGVFIVEAAPRHPATPQQLEAAIYEEIDRLKKEGPTEWEMEKVRNNEVVGLLHALDSNEGLAGRLADDQAVVGDWRDSWELVAKLEKVTPDDVKRVASELFEPDHRTVAYLLAPERSAKAEVKP
jgi:predicted Zn-dependent peptidase